MKLTSFKLSSPVYAFRLDGSSIFLPFPKDVSGDFTYEIEDETGRIITGKFSAAESIPLPRLGVGYYHFKIFNTEKYAECLLIISPLQIYKKTDLEEIKYHQPITGFRELRHKLSDDNLLSLHYMVPFPQEDDLLIFYRLLQKKHPSLEYIDIADKNKALYLALKASGHLNNDFNSWANQCYDYNKINSFKNKEFADKQADLVSLGKLALNEVDVCMRDITNYCHRHNYITCAHIDFPLAVDYQRYQAWRDRRILLTKKLTDERFSNYVPYNPEMLAEAYYEPFISLIRHAMTYADILFFDNPTALHSVLCQDSPFPDKQIHYDLSAILSIIAIESHRSKCMVAAKSQELTSELRQQLADYNIIITV